MPRLPKRKPPGASGAKLPPTVGFRIPAEFRETFEQRATLLGLSPGELAKIYVIERLSENEERASLNATLKTALDQIKEVQKPPRSQELGSVVTLLKAIQCQLRENRADASSVFEAVEQVHIKLNEDRQNFDSVLQALLSAACAPADAILNAVEKLHTRLNEHRQDFAFALQALLTSAGQVDQNKAKQWVENSINVG